MGRPVSLAMAVSLGLRRVGRLREGRCGRLLAAAAACLLALGQALGASVSGRVVVAETGQGLEGVLVAAGDKTALTDKDGKFIIQGLEPGLYRIEPRLAGYSFEPVWVYKLVEGDVAGLEFSAYEGAYTVRVRVVDGQGRGISGAIVRLNVQTVALTDSQGMCAFSRLGPGIYKVQVAHKQYAFSQAVVEVSVPPDAWVEFTGQPAEAGDVDRNGVVDERDLVALGDIFRRLRDADPENDPLPERIDAADVDGDGAVTVLDAVAVIERIVAGP